jgi:hypothetical protein
MRRQLLLFYPVLLCALVLSGWGGVLTAALCPHAAASARAATRAAQGMEMDDDHACCHREAKGAQKEHCSGSSHEAVGEAKRTTPAAERHPKTLAPSEASCSHCIGHSSLPVAPVKAGEPSQQGSDAHRLAQDESKPFAPPVAQVVSAIAPTQGAPPGPAARKHLLLSIFLI